MSTTTALTNRRSQQATRYTELVMRKVNDSGPIDDDELADVLGALGLTDGDFDRAVRWHADLAALPAQIEKLTAERDRIARESIEAHRTLEAERAVWKQREQELWDMACRLTAAQMALTDQLASLASSLADTQRNPPKFFQPVAPQRPAAPVQRANPDAQDVAPIVPLKVETCVKLVRDVKQHRAGEIGTVAVVWNKPRLTYQVNFAENDWLMLSHADVEPHSEPVQAIGVSTVRRPGMSVIG